MRQIRDKLRLAVLIFLGLVLSVSASQLLLDAETTAEKPENVVYISLDAVSAEHMECYGYHRETAPNICGLENSTLYENTYAASPWTLLSLASQQVGVYPHRANVIGTDTPLDTDYYTIAEILNDNDYETILKNRNPHMNTDMNSDQGFNRFDTDPTMEMLPSRFGEKLDDNLYYRTHIMAAHTPYDPRKPWFNHSKSDYRFIEEVNETLMTITTTHKPNLDRETQNISDEERQKVIDHYDENIRATDNYVGKFIDELKEKGQYEDSLIIINADHGEAFNNYGEGIWNHDNANPPIARVPMVIKYPGAEESRRETGLASHMDPFKIVLNEVGASVDYDLDAIDPRYEDREDHYTYTESAGYAKTNKTHFSFYNKREDSWSSYILDVPHARQIDAGLDDLRLEIQQFQRDVEGRVYDRYSPFEDDDENLRDRLEDLGYLS